MAKSFRLIVEPGNLIRPVVLLVFTFLPSLRSYDIQSALPFIDSKVLRGGYHIYTRC